MVRELFEALKNDDMEKFEELFDEIIEKKVRVKRVKACPAGFTRVGTFCKKLTGKELEKRKCLKTPGMKWDGERCVPMNGKEKRIAKLRARKAMKTKKKNDYVTVMKTKK